MIEQTFPIVRPEFSTAISTVGSGFGGGFSDSINVPFADAMLVKIPDSISMEEACGLSDNIADGFRTVAFHLAKFPQEPVLIVGGLARSIGLYAIQSALACGSSRVVYVDNDNERITQARSLGAETHWRNFSQTQHFPELFLITVDANCTSVGMAYTINSTAP